MLLLLLSLEGDIYISVGQGHNWSAIAMVTKEENEKLVQGEVYQAYTISNRDIKGRLKRGG